MTVEELHGIFQFTDDFLAGDDAKEERVLVPDMDFTPRKVYPNWFEDEAHGSAAHDDAVRFKIASCYRSGQFRKAMALSVDLAESIQSSKKRGNVAGVLRDLAETIVCCAMKLDDLEAARLWLNRLDGVEEPGRHIIKSEFFYRTREWQPCIEECTRFLALRPGDYKILLRQAECYMNLGQAELSSQALDEAMGIVRLNIELCRNDRVRLLLEKDLKEAVVLRERLDSHRVAYVVRFAQHWESFRLPELQAVAKMEGVDFEFDAPEYSDNDPFLTIRICRKDIPGLFRLLDRIILVKDIMELWAEGPSLDELHEHVKEELIPAKVLEPYMQSSFKFLVKSYNRTLDKSEQLDLINSFAYTQLAGPIRMADPDVVFGVFCDFSLERGHYYFGRYVGRSRRGKHLDNLDLKKREYLGTTSMDAELSLVMTNMALVQPGSLVYDPFVGTGSFLYTSGYFGGYAIGSDIDGRQMRGKTASSTPHRGPKYQKSSPEKSTGPASIQTNIEQYGLDGLILDGVVFDIAHHPWTDRLMLSAIVTDPPYGVRAGAKKLGASRPKDSKILDSLTPELRAALYPATQPYAIDEMTRDLLNFAAQHLIPGGRIVFWYPVDAEEAGGFEIASVSQHSQMNFVAASCHRCKGFHRWLVTLERK